MSFHDLCDHKLDPSCFFCLMRSLSLRSKDDNVKTPVSPVEVLGFLEDKGFHNLDLNQLITKLMTFLTSSEYSVSNQFDSKIFACNICEKNICLQGKEIIHLNIPSHNTNIQDVLSEHLKDLVKDHYETDHPKASKTVQKALQIDIHQNYLLLSLDRNEFRNLEKSINIGVKKFILELLCS